MLPFDTTDTRRIGNAQWDAYAALPSSYGAIGSTGGYHQLPYVTGRRYNLHWHNGGIDFTSLWMQIGYSKSNDLNTIFEFNYTDVRETFYVDVNGLKAER